MVEDLTTPEIERYARHLTLPEVGRAGQLQLKAASILLVVRWTGSPLAMYLAAAGVGRLEWSILTRSTCPIAAADDPWHQ